MFTAVPSDRLRRLKPRYQSVCSRLRIQNSGGRFFARDFLRFLFQQEIPQNQNVHFSAIETGQGFFGPADDRFVVVKRCVQQNRNACEVAKGADQPPVERMSFAANGLQPRGAVNMRWRRNYGALRRAHRIRKGHKRRWMSALEIFSCGFLENRRSEGPEGFAMFDAAVERFLHLSAARIGEYAAASQSTRTPFSATLVPADNFSLSNVFGRSVHEGVFLELGDLNIFGIRLAARYGFANLLRCKTGAPKGVIHLEAARLSENLMVYGKGGAQRKTAIASGRLDVDALERRTFENFSIRHAIESDATGQAERFRLSSRVEGIHVGQ